MYLVRAIINGLSDGGIIALAAISVTLVFRISRFANVATGDMLTVGAYIAFFLSVNLGMSFGFSIVLAALITGVIGIVSYLFVFKPLRFSPVTLFISSIGLALVLRAVVLLIWGTNVLAFQAVSVTPISLGAVRVARANALVIAACTIVVPAFFLLLYKTRLGQEIRATASDVELARTNGINVQQVRIVVWFCASVLAGIAGVLLAASTSLQPEMGWNLLLPAFAAAILGGLGNTTGAAIGGFIIGIAMQLAVMSAPAGYKPVIAFVIMIAVLLIRPAGLIPSRDRL